MKLYAIIVAAGKGLRMENEIPKQFLEINKIPLLIHTINRFLEFDRGVNIIVGLPEVQIDTWKQICLKFHFNEPHTIIKGGNTRFDTVKNCLVSITDESIVAIHDGVRPLVSIDTIKKCYETALSKGTAIPVIPLNESIRVIKNGENKAVNREEYRIVQTPQVFQSKIIKEAYKTTCNIEFTDDAAVVENAGYKINLVEGNKDNIKITYPSDLVLAEKILSEQVNGNL